MNRYNPQLQYINNELYFDGCSLKDIKAQYGTPAYVLSATSLKTTLSEIKQEFIDSYENVLPLYASKALSIQYLYQQVEHYGLGVDVVSSGEIFVALQAGTDPNKIYFHGNNKSVDEIEYALKHNVTHFIIDNFHEIHLIEEVAKALNVQVQGMVRIVPQVTAGGHSYIQTGAIDTKFGFSTHDDSYINAIKEIMKSSFIHFIGIHAHVGSQILEVEPFIKVATSMCHYAIEIYNQLGILIEELNIGGGYGIAYQKDQNVPTFKEIIHPIMKTIDEAFHQKGLSRPKILIEPGRSIIGNQVITLYTIGARKEIPGVRTYVSVDGGMSDNIRPSLYQAKYDAFPVTLNQEVETVTLAGKCCESGDILIKDIELPKLIPGELIAVTSTGAYNYSMSMNYNQLRKPPIVLVEDGKHRLIVRRQTFEDLILCEEPLIKS